MPEWAWWLVAGGGLAVLELLLPAMFFVMLAVGAGGAALAAALGAGLVVQAVVFAVVSLLMLVLVRPAARTRMMPAETRSGAAALVGTQAVVVRRVSADAGLVRIGGEEWTARSMDPGVAFEPGDHVMVVEIKGATAYVWAGP